MPAPKDKALNYGIVLKEIMNQATGPLAMPELVDLMLARLPSSARNPRQAMRNHILQENGRKLVFLDADTLLPLRLAYQGARFRLPLQRESFDRGLLPLDYRLISYLPRSFALDKLQFVDSLGQAIPFQIQQVTQKVRSFFGETDETHSFADLSAWYRAQKMYIRDHLLVTILDWDQGILRLEREAFSQRDQALVDERNRLLAELFFVLLEGANREDLSALEAVPTVYARLPDKGGCPPNDWLTVLDVDGRMGSNGWTIFYQDSNDPFYLFEETKPQKRQKAGSVQRLADEQQKPVYRFKAFMPRRPKIWREIEIQGRHTLYDLDQMMREAFNHDFMDHMSGFWKLVPRAAQAKTMAQSSSGHKTRYREVDLGDINPFGEGGGAKVKIAELELAVGSELKYVYDFGDWIEHRLKLLAIEPPQSEVEYPRESGRNEPKYQLCTECQKTGKQQNAVWICLECSHKEGQEVLSCEKCSDKKHEGHYLEEILY